MGGQTREEREAQRKAAIAAFAPAMAYLREHHHPHALAIVRDAQFEIHEGVMGHVEPESAQPAAAGDLATHRITHETAE